MNVEIHGIHLQITERINGYIDKKLPRLDFAKNLVVDFMCNISKEGSGFKCDATIHFRWGNVIHLSAESFDIFQGIDKLFDKIEEKIIREKAKVQNHRGGKEPQTTEVPEE